MNLFMGKGFVRSAGGGGKGQDTQNLYSNGNDGGKGVKRALLSAKIIIAVVVLAIAALDSFYTLSENEMAVVTTFGRPVSVMNSGPKFKYPFIQKVYKMSKEIRGMAIGYDNTYNTQDPAYSENNPLPVTTESEMITRDFNFVNVDFYIEYQIIDPIKAYINSESSIDILKNLAQSYIRDTVGSYSVDEVITTGKSEIQGKVKTLLSQRLEQEDIGIGIYNVTIQDAEPPTEAVNNAFKAVEDAKQGMDTKLNEAKKYQSEQVPAANAKADKAARDAEAYRQQRISEAEGQVSRFNDMYEEYVKYPLITKKRMFYETMEEVLPDLKVIINGSEGTQTVLPLDSFVGSPEKGGGQQ
ncbi:MAG: FtsH protease activity modulator HflK [Clostridium sp.]|nr:FtsH protease activity modulator HflK [Clostridium sp.]